MGSLAPLVELRALLRGAAGRVNGATASPASPAGVDDRTPCGSSTLAELAARQLPPPTLLVVAAASALLLLLVVLAQLLLNPLERWRMRRVPGFAWRPLLGSLPIIASRGAHEFFLEGHRRFVASADAAAEKNDRPAPPPLYRPAVWKAWFGPRAWLVVTDAEVARRVLSRVSARPPLSALGPTRADRANPGLFMARGAQFHALRRAWQPAFAPASLERYAPLMARAAGDLVARLRAELAAADSAPPAPPPSSSSSSSPSASPFAAAGPPLTNLHQAVGDLSMAVVGSCAFGVDFATIATGGVRGSAAASSTSAPPPPSSATCSRLPRRQPSFSWRSEGRELVRAAAATFAAMPSVRTGPWGAMAAAAPWAAPLLRELAERWPDEGLMRMQEARKSLARAALRLIEETRRRKLREQEEEEEERGRSPSPSPAAARSPPPSSSSSLGAPASRATGIAPGSFLAQLMAFSDAHAAGRRSAAAAARAPCSPPAAPRLSPSQQQQQQQQQLSPAAAAAAAASAAAPQTTTGAFADALLVMQAQTFMLGGSDTTTLAISMATALLARHPDKAARLRAEIDAADAAAAAAAGNADADADPSLQPAAAMPYAAACVDEALRLFPPGALILRDPSALPAEAPPLELPLLTDGLGGEPGNRSNNSVLVPRTARVFVDMYAIHRDPRYWPRASEFLPERFLAPEHGGDPSLRPSTPAAYMPFGSGARACPGAKFALREARCVLVALHRAFEFEVPDGAWPVRLVTGITLSPVGGVWVRLRERRRAGEAAGAAFAAAASAPPLQPLTPTPSTPTRLK